MTEPNDHNAARWLVARWLPAERRAGYEAWPRGWYVVRTCPCHFGQRVVRHPLESEEQARHAIAVVVHAAEALKIDV